MVTIARLIQVARRRWLLVLLVTLAAGLVAGADRTQTFIRSGRHYYGSTAKLLLRRDSARVRALKTPITVQPGRGTTADILFFDPEEARKLVEDDAFLDRVQARLPGPEAKLPHEQLRVRILLSPTSLSFDQLVSIADESGQSNLEDLETLESIDVENSYFTRGQLRLLTLSVWSDTPEGAKHLGRGVLEELKAEVKRRAGATYTAHRINEENIYKKLLQQVVISEKKLRKLNPTQATAEELEARFYQLEQARLRMRMKVLEEVGKVESLRSDSHQPVIAAGASEASESLNVFRDAMSELESKLADDRKLYSEDSPQVMSTQAQIRLVHQLVEQHWEELQLSLRADRVAHLMAYRQRLAEVEKELGELRDQSGSEKRRRQARMQQQALAKWEEAARLQLAKVYKARVEEQIAQARGTMGVLQEPQLGADLSGVARRLSSNRVVAGLALLPAGFFGGLLLAVAVDGWHRRYALSARLKRELRLPILASLPTLDRPAQQRWKAMKASIFEPSHRSASGRSEGA